MCVTVKKQDFDTAAQFRSYCKNLICYMPDYTVVATMVNYLLLEVNTEVWSSAFL